MSMKRFDQINVIPFIDIMLVLLAIVLTTATFISQGKIEISVPIAESTTVQQQDEKVLEIAISDKNEFFLDEKATTLDRLEQELANLPKETAITLRVDKSVNFEHFISVVDILKKNSLEKLSIITREK